MKTKEQLAEDHVNKRYPEAEWTTYQRNFAEQDFKAGYDARDAHLGKLPEFDETEAIEGWCESSFDQDSDSCSAFTGGARWQHQQDAKVIAAKDKLLADRIRVDAKHIEQLQASCTKRDEKIRELEESGGRKNLVDKTNKLEIATSCINEMQNLLKPYMNPNNSLGETITKAFNLGALFNSNNHDLFNQYLATTEKIKELEKANADCISLYLHEQRMKDANELIDELNKCLNIELIEEIAIRGVCYGGDGFGFSLAQKQMNDVYKMMLDLSLITEKIKAYKGEK